MYLLASCAQVMSSAYEGSHKECTSFADSVGGKSDVRKFPWLEFNPDKMEGVFLGYPERDQIPEKINEQLIVELYSK
jgi:small subunit ribosomal protein S4